MKKPVVLISPEGKTPEELVKEFMKALRNFWEKEEKAKKYQE